MAYGPSRLRKWALASAAVGALILAVDAQAQTQVTGGGTGVAENAASDDATAADNYDRRHRLAYPPQPAGPERPPYRDRQRGYRAHRPVLDRRRAANACRVPRADSIPASTAPAITATRPMAAASAPGSAEIDLRYLGSRRTLVLVDGLRFINGSAASGIPGAVDLNAIPDSMIERVDVLRDGASTIYGSDAIAGVVNIITKKRQNGFLATAQLGGYDKGDGVTQNYQLSWATGRRTTASPSWSGELYQPGIGLRGRPALLRLPDPGATACTTTCSSGTPNGRSSSTTPSRASR